MRVTAIMPVRNVEQWLVQSIESIFAQTRVPDEILIVDDCSTDGTRDIVRRYADRGVRLLSTPVASGGPAARNVGIKAATGDIIVMLDGDDYWLPRHCEVVVGLLEKFPQADLSFSATRAFGGEQWVWPMRLPDGVPVNCFWQCLRRTTVPHMNVCYRRSVLLAAGCYREHFIQTNDFELFLRLSEKSLFVCSHEITSAYRKHPGSITVRSPHRGIYFKCLARWEYWCEHKDSLSPRRRQRLMMEIQRRWLLGVSAAWRACDSADLRAHLRYARYVPGVFWVYWLYRWRAETILFRKLKLAIKDWLRPISRPAPRTVPRIGSHV